MARAILWWRRGDLSSATATAATIGRGFGYGMIGLVIVAAAVLLLAPAARAARPPVPAPASELSGRMTCGRSTKPSPHGTSLSAAINDYALAAVSRKPSPSNTWRWK